MSQEELQSAEEKQEFSYEAYEKLRMEQNLILGIILGLIVGVVCAILWGIITVVTNYQIGYMAIAVGALVGLTVRKFGKGIDATFGYAGAIIALISVVLGNVLSLIGYSVQGLEIEYVEALKTYDYSLIPDQMAAFFSYIDLLFYGIAVYVGYHFSFRKIKK